MQNPSGPVHQVNMQRPDGPLKERHQEVLQGKKQPHLVLGHKVLYKENFIFSSPVLQVNMQNPPGLVHQVNIQSPDGPLKRNIPKVLQGTKQPPKSLAI